MVTSFLILVIIVFNSVLQHLRETKSNKLNLLKYETIQKFPLTALLKDLLEVDWDEMIASGAHCPDRLFSTFYNK